MSTVVVAVTQPTRTVTATPTSSGHPPSISSGAIAGIVIGVLLGGVLFIALFLYLLDRYTRHKFTRVANPAHDDAERAHLSSRRSQLFPRHSKRPSTSSEPLMSPASWPPLPTTSRVLSPSSPPRLDPVFRDSQYSSFDLGEIGQLAASDSSIPARQVSPPSLQPDVGNTPPLARRTTDDSIASPSTPTKSNQTLFLHRMLKSRAQASEGVALAHRPSLGLSRSPTFDSSDVHGDEERLLAEAEQSALRDAEMGEEVAMATGEEVESTESIYSQGSAPIDHPMFLSESVSRPNSSLSVARRKSSRKRPRTPVPSTDLSPVAEVPDAPRVVEGQTVTRSVSTAANSSLDTRVSHHRAADESGTAALPLLTSANFGKDSTPSGTSGSISSTAGWGSGSSGRASRYPSLAASSSLQSGPRSDAGTDWHNLPSGLSGLTSLQIGPLQNPHSPVDERPERHDTLFAEPRPVRRAHLREGTASSLPEVERRDVMQGGIVHIDVAL